MRAAAAIGLVGALLTLGGLLAVVNALTVDRPTVTAVRITATALDNLTSDECDNGHELKVRFEWHGGPVEEVYDPPCTRDYRAGDRIVAYAESDDASVMGPTRDWVLHPDQHDPFDFIGPNGTKSFLIGSGIILMVAGSSAGTIGLVMARRRT